MNSLSVALSVLLSALALSHAAPKEDLITDLPGLHDKPSFKQYSGYLQALGTRKLHYWFVVTENIPSLDAVVLWMNGGPGCSSMDGLLSEHGPFLINPDGRTLRNNNYTWNNIGSIIYLEAPAGVGFSYATDGNYTINDDETAANNLAALKDFFTKFPEFKYNDFYVTGESYGGVYVPTLVSAIIDDGSINLKGFAVGNGLSDTTMNTNSLVLFAYYHGLIGPEKWRTFVEECCPHNVSDHCDFVNQSLRSKNCTEQMNKLAVLIWSAGLDPYNLYSECHSDNSLHYDSVIGKFVSSNIMKPFPFLPKAIKEEAFLDSLPSESVSVGPPCINDTAITMYLNTPQVRTALHIPAGVPKWELCRRFGYQQQYHTMIPFYKKALAHKLKILVYNGDVDMACNFLGGEWFVDSLPLKNPRDRKLWYSTHIMSGKKQISGFVKKFDQLTFVTIKGAGHMVATDKPFAAQDMLVNFVMDFPF